MADENNQFIIVFNGEIYNFKKLRKNLEKIGIFFKSNSDTEVLLKLYQTKKEKMLDEIEGMFSLVIYDKIKKVIFLARDRFGIKPLYYINFNIFSGGRQSTALLSKVTIGLSIILG